MDYKDQLKSPLWQKKRLEIFERDNWTCQICLDKDDQLHVHHKVYENGLKAWEYGNDRLITLCSVCHKAITAHIDNFKNDAEFDVKKIGEGKEKLILIYSKGNILARRGEYKLSLSENESFKLVQFIINNWLKNG